MTQIFLSRKAAQRELFILFVGKCNIALGTERIEVGGVLPGADSKHDSFETDVERPSPGQPHPEHVLRPDVVAAIDVNSPDELVKWSILCRSQHAYKRLACQYSAQQGSA